ncbi:MFS transporter [Butyrivibrio sp. AE3003]|uniref:MFS transporter n=1 Tax=Butyrivibrio sp. AE3003 TaxID=1496721 RepID=UPI00047C359C|nr:MFS transporter [Butyrivibrio sp. AE3003]
MGLFTQYKGLKRENYILFIGRIATNLGAMIWPILTMILNKKLGMNATDTAMFSIISGLFFLPANIWGGHLADKFNKKKLIIFCDIISIILYITSGFLPLSLFAICVIMAGSFFQTLEHPAYSALVADITPKDKREKAFSLLYLGKNIGLILAPTIAGFLFNNHLQLCFIINGLAISISTVLIGLFVKDKGFAGREAKSNAMVKKAGNETIWSAIKSSTALIFFIIAMCFQEGAYSQFGYLMPLDISKAYPETGAAIYGSVASLNCIIVVLFTPFMTMLLEKVSLAKKIYDRNSISGAQLCFVPSVIWSDRGILYINNSLYIGRNPDGHGCRRVSGRKSICRSERKIVWYYRLCFSVYNRYC